MAASPVRITLALIAAQDRALAYEAAVEPKLRTVARHQESMRLWTVCADLERALRKAA